MYLTLETAVRGDLAHHLPVSMVPQAVTSVGVEEMVGDAVAGKGVKFELK